MSIKKLSLTQEKKQEPKKEDIDFLYCFDFSGSMHYVLPRIKEYMYEAITNGIPNGSHVSVAYFSSTGDHKTILKRFKIDEELDRRYLKSKLDDEFRSRGLTTFTGGLAELIELASDSSNSVKAVEFVTDGYDNGSSKKDILDMVRQLSAMVTSLDIVEFGNYCNHELLVEMSDIASENCASKVVYSKDYSAYGQKLAESVGKTSFSPLAEIDAPSDAEWAIVGEGQYRVANGKVKVPKDADTVYFMSNTENVDLDNLTIDEAYLLAYHAGYRMYTDLAYKILSKTGDMLAWRLWDNAIGKQRTNEALAFILECWKNPSKRLQDGYSDSLKSDPDAFCLLDALELLQSDEDAKFYPYEQYGFKYTGITAPKADKSSVITDEERELINQYSKDNRIDDIKKILNGKYKIKFKQDKEDPFSFSDLVFNHDKGRANLSIRGKIHGHADISSIDFRFKEPISCHKYKTYAIIHDGNVNVPELMIEASKSTLDTLEGHGCLEYKDGKAYFLIYKLGVVNRNMAKNIEAKKLAEAGWEMEKLKGQIKVVNDYLKTTYGKKVNAELQSKYGEEEAQALLEYGFTHDGFSPKKVQLGEFKEEPYSYLTFKYITGAKGGEITFPSVNAVEKKDEGKRNIAEKIMGKEIAELRKALKLVEGQEEKAKEYLESRLSLLRSAKRSREYGIAKAQFALLLTKKWFSDIDKDTNEVFVSDSEYGNIKCEINFGDVK